MDKRPELLSIEDVKTLVNSFYNKVQQDKVLAPIFNDIIKDKWTQHLEKMYTFWQTVLLDQHNYFGSPFLPHAKLPLEQEHFDIWLSLFYKTIDENFSGEKAKEAKWRSEKMAAMFLAKITYYREHPEKQAI